jgi:outer membrane protein
LKKNFVVFPALVLGMAVMASAQTPAKVAIIHVQNAILQTKDGQKAATELQARFAPKKANWTRSRPTLRPCRTSCARAAGTRAKMPRRS